MADIFISYAKEDRARIEPLAKALAEQGWSVWWGPKDSGRPDLARGHRRGPGSGPCRNCGLVRDLGHVAMGS